MRLIINSSVTLFAACGIFSLTACGNSEQSIKSPNSLGTDTVSVNSSHHSHHHGHTAIHTDIAHAQIILSDPYHLELIAESKDHGINLNFHLEINESHEAIPDANVKAIVQKPDGDEETLDLKYEAEGEHYIGSVHTDALGPFGVTVLADIDGEQVDAVFAFDR